MLKLSGISWFFVLRALPIRRSLHLINVTIMTSGYILLQEGLVAEEFSAICRTFSNMNANLAIFHELKCTSCKNIRLTVYHSDKVEDKLREAIMTPMVTSQ